MPLKSREALPIRTVSTLTATSAVDIHSSDYRFTPRRRAATYTLPKKMLISMNSTSLVVEGNQESTSQDKHALRREKGSLMQLLGSWRCDPNERAFSGSKRNSRSPL